MLRGGSRSYRLMGCNQSWHSLYECVLMYEKANSAGLQATGLTVTDRNGVLPPTVMDAA